MVNILAAVTGGILSYGTTSMESDRVLKDWIEASCSKCIPISQGEEAKWGKLLMMSATHRQLAKDDTLLKNADNFEEFIKVLSSSSKKEWSHKNWLESCGHMTEVAKLLNQAETQNLFGLALSTTFGRPLRYCIQYEVTPAAGYWSYYADQLDSTNETTNKTTVVIVGSSNPLLAVSRAISPIASRGLNIILVPENNLFAIPCLLMGEIFSKAGLHCSVYAGSRDRLKEITALEDVNVIVCGSYEQAISLRDGTTNLKLDVDGKKVVVVMETGDCDAAVDAALTALKTSCCTGAGQYLIVQDSMMEEVDWRLRERFNKSHSGELLDKMVDFADHSRFAAPQKVIDYLGKTNLDVLKVGNARIVFDAQPSMPLTQWSQLGQSLLVFSYRSMGELLNLVGNLTGLSEISLWTENQSVALHVTNQIQVPRIWVNGFASYEPGFDHLVPIIEGTLKTAVSDGKVNTALYAVLDGLRTTQRSWSNVGNRNVLMTKFLKQLLVQEAFSAKTSLILELITTISRHTGKVATSTTKRGLVFDLADPVGVVAIIASDSDRLDSLIRFISMALLKGNAIMLSTNTDLHSVAQILVKVAKEAGLPNVLLTCPNNDENHRALLKHHGIRMLVTCGTTSLPALTEAHIKRILQLNSSSEDYLMERKWAWVATGEGLAS